MTEKQIHRICVKEISEYLKNEDGCFVECGVKYGTSAIIMAKTMECDGVLFDTWKGFVSYSKHDATTHQLKNRMKRRVKGSRKNTFIEMKNNLVKNNVEGLCETIRGDICKTVPEYVLKNDKLKIKFMHIDTDMYEPAKVSLECFWPMMSDRGIVLFHDYGSPYWPGIKKLVDDFVKDKNCFFSSSNTICAAVVSKHKYNDLNFLSNWKK